MIIALYTLLIPKKYCPLILSKFWQNHKLQGIGIEFIIFACNLSKTKRNVLRKYFSQGLNALVCY